MKDKRIETNKAEKNSEKGRLSPIELIKMRGGNAHKVRGDAVTKGADAMLAVYKGRFTYTFVMNKEVASIYFDVERGKIFFSGHNIQNMQLTQAERDELFKLIKVLGSDTEGRELKDAYEATLGSLLADNR